MKLPWKSGEITDKDAMWSTEINYGDGNGDGHGEGWSKIVKDGKRQWELVFTALSLHFHCISAFDFLSKNVPKFWLCRWTFISQKKKADHQFWLCLVNSVNSVYIISRFDDFITLKIGNSGNSVNSSNFKMSGHTMWLSWDLSIVCML